VLAGSSRAGRFAGRFERGGRRTGQAEFSRPFPGGSTVSGGPSGRAGTVPGAGRRSGAPAAGLARRPLPRACAPRRGSAANPRKQPRSGRHHEGRESRPAAAAPSRRRPTTAAVDRFRSTGPIRSRIAGSRSDVQAGRGPAGCALSPGQSPRASASSRSRVPGARALQRPDRPSRSAVASHPLRPGRLRSGGDGLRACRRCRQRPAIRPRSNGRCRGWRRGSWLRRLARTPTR
jgi:hypothetical protein